MAIKTSVGHFVIPREYTRSGATVFTDVLLDAAGEKIAWIVQAPAAGTINRIGFRTGAVSSGATMDCRIESLNLTDQFPSGSLWAADTNGGVSASAANTWYEAALTSGANVNRGDLFAIVIVVPSGGNLNLQRTNNVTQPPANHTFPYFAANQGSWVVAASTMAIVGARFSTGVWVNLQAMPVSDIAVTSFNNGSTPDERALRFRLPFPARISGVQANLGTASGGDFAFKLYDSNGTTVLASYTHTGFVAANTNPTTGTYFFTSAVNLLANTFYRVSVLPSSSNNAALTGFTVDSAAIMDSFDGGQDFHLSTRKSAGAWTDTTTQRPLIYLMSDGFDDGAGGGGGLLTHPGMGGGMRG
jgi:hypothetical protein